MIRLFLSFAFTILAARWMYAEIALVAPGAIPAINYALTNIQIPTHDKWDTEAIGIMAKDMGLSIEKVNFVDTAEAADFSYRHEPYSNSNYDPNYGVRYVRASSHNRPCRSGACDMF